MMKSIVGLGAKTREMMEGIGVWFRSEPCSCRSIIAPIALLRREI